MKDLFRYESDVVILLKVRSESIDSSLIQCNSTGRLLTDS